MKNLIFSAFALCLILSCKQEIEHKESAIVIDGIDSSISPGDDFFNYVNKTWYDKAVIADDQVGVGSYQYLNIPQKKLLQKLML